MIKNFLKNKFNSKIFSFFLTLFFLFTASLYAKKLDLLNIKNWVLIGENKRGEKLFYEKNSLKNYPELKLSLTLLYLPSDEIAQRCEEYWMNWFLMNEYREVMWSGIPKEEKAKCKSLKYGIYTWQIDCKKRNFREMDFVWYNNKGIPVYTRKNVGISFLFIPEDLVKTLFDKFCKH
ncbi:MAG: hypothetical protein OD816_001072 [Thermodesulfobacterium sp.]|uniref:Uncharacterized protein n=1 Tax=Candidatus Thermodesulfobacterium syntrophicum TaxID=3060442 RepID=A0AAE3P0Q7_9BACT|nr:hypothetical protein [Candidatus Thermodesulfobacterium syntrophicum]